MIVQRYPEPFVAPMREELTTLGFEELRTPESVDAAAYTPRGHLTIYRDQRGGTGDDPVDGTPFPGFSADNEAALAEIVTEAGRRGSRVVLLLEPGGCPPILPGCADAESERRALEALREIAAELGVDLINGRALDTPADWYADSAHFNSRGTVEFTEFSAAALDGLAAAAAAEG